MRRLRIASLIFAFAATFAMAQTTTNWVMVGAGQSSCHSNFTHPTSFYQFSCNINFQKDNGDGTFGPDTGEMIGTNVLFFNPTGFDITGGTPYLLRMSKVLQDIAPANGQPGQATWEWEVETQDGMFHVGVLTMQWALGPCTRSGCQVHVLEAQTTVDSEPVEIFF